MLLKVTITRYFTMFNVTKITFLPYSDAWFELQQIVLMIC